MRRLRTFSHDFQTSKRRKTMQPRIRRPWFGCMLLLALALSGPAKAQLTVTPLTPFSVSIEVGPNAGPTVTTDPLFASNTIGTAFAEANLVAGTLRASVDAIPDPLLARASLQVFFQNAGAMPITFPAGAFSAHVDADLAGGPGDFLKLFQASLSLNPLAFSAAGVFYAHQVQSPLPIIFDVLPVDVTVGSHTIINTGTASALDVDFELAGFTLDPGGSFLMLAAIDAQATAPAGSSALVDAASTFSVSLVLPEGVTFSSPVPLSWVTAAVTPVPEPETWALMLAGLTGLGFVSRRRRQSAGRTPQR